MIRWMKRAALFAGTVFAAAVAADAPLVLDAGQFQPRNGAKVEWKAGVLSLKIHNPEWSGGVRINPPEGTKFDFSNARYLACDVENLGDRQMRLTMHISSGRRDSDSSSHVDLRHRQTNTGIGLNPGEKRTMRIYLPHAALFRAPGGGKNMRVLDTAKINSIEFQLQWPFEALRRYLADCRISNIRLEGEPEYNKKIAGSDTYFPFIDRYGQYMHSDWPEKIHADDELVAEHRRELAELDGTPDIAAWNEYGGWANGPALEATGAFRVQKYDGKWFFVDPSGRLFWSTGIDVLRNHTDATSRRHPEWFSADVPQEQTLPFTHWNLQKKYGKADYENEFYAVLARRLRAWGINSIGNWGSSEFMAMGKIPYTMSLGEINSKALKGIRRLQIRESGGKFRSVKFYDVFDPAFEEKMGNLLRLRAEETPSVKKSIDDPMCIGYFVDNELQFGGIVGGVVKAVPDQPAKLELIRDLMAKYDGSIEKLNEAWKTKFADWDAFAANNKTIPDSPAYRADVGAFRAKFADRYFEICKRGIKSVAPHRLYLGCRFVGFRQNGDFWKAAAKHCDVLSVNTYTNSVVNVPAKNFLDKPMLVGEFHFGALDRGMFAPGLCPVGSQEERATSYMRFLQGALTHPNFVGTHYFQFRDQPLTGRWDGEGYQIGFVDVADTPYPELCKAAREVGENMYRYRMNGKTVNEMK